MFVEVYFNSFECSVESIYIEYFRIDGVIKYVFLFIF